jgi:hypothetical protein
LVVLKGLPFNHRVTLNWILRSAFSQFTRISLIISFVLENENLNTKDKIMSKVAQNAKAITDK